MSMNEVMNINDTINDFEKIHDEIYSKLNTAKPLSDKRALANQELVLTKAQELLTVIENANEELIKAWVKLYKESQQWS